MMRSLFIAAFTALVCSIAVIMLVSCHAKSDGDETETVESTSAEVTESTNTCQAQKILDDIYNNVTLKDGRIYLTFGERSTLTVDNFNRLILEDQLGLADDRYTFLIDPNILSLLRHNNAYGGIGYGQEWIAAMDVCLKDNYTGEVSDHAELVFTLLKSEEADRKLTPTVQVITDVPEETTK